MSLTKNKSRISRDFSVVASPWGLATFCILGWIMYWSEPRKLDTTERFTSYLSPLWFFVVFYLLPQRFILPPTGKTHHGGLHHWVSAQERSEVLNEGVLGIDAVEPIGNAAKLRIARVMGCFVYSILKETSHPGPLVLRREAWWDLLVQRYAFYLE